MACCPLEDTLAIHHFVGEFACVSATVCEDSCALTVLLVTGPLALVLGDNAISIWLARKELQPMTVTDHLELTLSFLSG